MRVAAGREIRSGAGMGPLLPARNRGGANDGVLSTRATTGDGGALRGQAQVWERERWRWFVAQQKSIEFANKKTNGGIEREREVEKKKDDDAGMKIEGEERKEKKTTNEGGTGLWQKER